MKFKELFEKYWDNLIVGIIAGLVLYYGLKIQDGIKAAIYIFTISLFLILIYTFFVWMGKKHNWDKRFVKFFKKFSNKIKKNFGKISLIVGMIALLISIFGIYLAYYQIEYPKLIVNHAIVDKGDGNGRLQIYVKNNALFKPTGEINFFRMDINPSIPHMQVDSLDPGENITFDTDIKIFEKNYTFQREKSLPGALSRYGIPAHKLYFIMEEISLSYRITCDNCHSQGILKRIPELGSVETSFTLNQLTGEMFGVLKIYNWTTYSLEDLE